VAVKLNFRFWPDVLSGVRAALQPLKILGLGERQLTAGGPYSPYRPKPADQGYVSIFAGGAPGN
jgi:hypothetical protein